MTRVMAWFRNLGHRGRRKMLPAYDPDLAKLIEGRDKLSRRVFRLEQQAQSVMGPRA